MKLPVDGNRSMLRTAQPNGLDPAFQRPYAKYFSRFISAYKARGIPMWGVTVQNEAEAADVGWEKCVWTPAFQARFVREHLGPVLRADHPGTKIIGFDHNKDHVRRTISRTQAQLCPHMPTLRIPQVMKWAEGLYQDAGAREFFDGIGVHWYGGLNTQNLDNTHTIAPDKCTAQPMARSPPAVRPPGEICWASSQVHPGHGGVQLPGRHLRAPGTA